MVSLSTPKAVTTISLSATPSERVILMMEEDILVASEKGYGKRTKIEDYRVTNRGGKGVKTMKISEKTGDLITITSVTDENDLMIINKSGITLRLSMNSIRLTGRATQGVRLINLEKKQDEIASVTKVLSEKIEEQMLETGSRQVNLNEGADIDADQE